MRRSVALGRVPRADLADEFGQDGPQIADHAEIGDLEDGSIGVLVDRDDRLRGLHAGQVLHGTGDAQRDVHVGCHRHAGLPDLKPVVAVAGVDGCA
ncbi:hypothetical protein SDC9_121681 [bioreactor metagenome]|uniref:Uncharacterized protein n=1 Tax=bioreactor metagenome TaxID=1076179 RepID=A0A645CCU1_9ZZZZ